MSLKNRGCAQPSKYLKTFHDLPQRSPGSEGQTISQATKKNFPSAPLTFLLLLITILVSCTGTTRKIQPPIAVQEKFSISGKSLLADKWWMSFNDPTLNRLIDKALGDNLQLKSVWDRLAQTEAVAQKTRADFFPTLDLQSRAFRSESRGGGSSSDVRRQTSSFNNFSLGMIAGYELDLWGRIQSNQDAAELDLKASAQDLQAAAITLSAQVAETWYQLVEQYGQLELLSIQLRTSEQVLELMTLRFRRGKIGATDVLQQRQLIESIRGEILISKSRAKILEHQIAILLGQSPSAQVTKRTIKLVPLPPLPNAGLPSDLVRRRPDIQQAYLKLLAADRRVASAISDRFPRISLSVQIDSSSDKVRDLFSNWLTTFAANLVRPLLDGGSRKAEVERTHAVTSERLHEYAQTILDSLREVEDALTQERRQKALILSLNKQLKLSKQVIERIRDRYAHGTVDYLRILDVLLTDQTLERNLLEAHRKLIEFRIALHRALAGGWEMIPPKQASTLLKNPGRLSLTNFSYFPSG